MRVGTRTTLAMLLVAGIPLAIAAWSAVTLSEKALVKRAVRASDAAAEIMAARISNTIDYRLRTVELAATGFDLSTLAADERTWALRLVFRQVPGASAVALFDSTGNQAAEPVFLSERPEDVALQERQLLKAGDIDRFAGGIPFALAREMGRAVGPAYVSVDGSPRVAVAVKGRGDFVLAVELSLDSASSLIDEYEGGSGTQVFVVDESGRVILASDAVSVANREDRSSWPIIQQLTKGEVQAGVFTHPKLGPSLTAARRVSGLGWAVVIAEPKNQALAGARHVVMRMLMVFGAALLLAALLGVGLSRTISKPIQALHQGTKAIEHGDFDHRVPERAQSDELGDLARAFNRMAAEVQGWRSELENKVKERTQELHKSQDLLIRAQKMAAVGQLGASVSHEINNPLFAVLATTEMMLADPELDTEHREDLEEIHRGSLRIKDIVTKLLQMADEETPAQQQPIEVVSVLAEVLDRLGTQLDAAGMRVVREFGESLPDVLGDPKTLDEAFVNLIDNAQLAMMASTGTLTVSVSADAQILRVQLQDDGSGISEENLHRVFDPFFTTRLQAGSKGLGLARVNQIIRDHHGSIVVDSLAKGASFTILLPTIQKRSIV